jgi:hypothetical protein
VGPQKVAQTYFSLVLGHVGGLSWVCLCEGCSGDRGEVKSWCGEAEVLLCVSVRLSSELGESGFFGR